MFTLNFVSRNVKRHFRVKEALKNQQEQKHKNKDVARLARISETSDISVA